MPDTLTVTETHTVLTPPTAAEVDLALDHTSWGGRGAARVAMLREHLTARGVPERDLTVVDVSTASWAWLPISLAILGTPAAALFARGWAPAGAVFALCMALLVVLSAARVASVTTRLRVRCADPAAVAEVLDAALHDPRVAVRGVRWDHQARAEARDEWTRACVVRAARRAESIAAVLGVHLVGVHAFHASDVVPLRQRPLEFVRAEVPARRRMGVSVAHGDLGPSLAPTEGAGVTVTVVYRVRPLAGAGPTPRG